MEFLKTPATSRSGPQPGAPPVPAGGGPSMEVAHVLYMDIVGYSRLRTNQQAGAQMELQNLVNASAEVQQAKSERKFICRPAGDGMALLFFRDIASPVRTALQLHEEMARQARSIQARVGAPLKLRMGIHSGVVLMVEDLNAQSDAAGDGINTAQRVMDCGDADHILVSSKVAESLLTVDPWQHYLRDIGECRVKHGQVVHLYLLHGRLSGGYFGNVAIPQRVAAEQNAMEQEANRYRASYFDLHPEMRGRLAFLAVAAVLIGGVSYAWKKSPTLQHTVRATWQGLTHRAPSSGPQDPHHPPFPGEHEPPPYDGPLAAPPPRRQPPPPRSYHGDHPSRVMVPDLLGKDMDDATSTAESQGLYIGRQPVSGYNTQFAEGQIYSQSPAAGSYASPGSHISVKISKGDPPDPSANGPDNSAGQ